MSPIEQVVYNRLKEINQELGAVTGVLLAQLNGWSERSTRYWLRRMEELGLVARQGVRSGWRAV